MYLNKRYMPSEERFCDFIFAVIFTTALGLYLDVLVISFLSKFAQIVVCILFAIVTCLVWFWTLM
jgi:hypothetical protein